MSLNPFCAPTNWAGNITFRPSQVLQPTTINELKAVVRASKKIRVVGSRHSFNAIAATDHTWIDLRYLEVPVKFYSPWPPEGEPITPTAVEVPAAMRLSVVNERLAERGQALASLGDIDRQQIGGLIATSTHGSGLDWGTMSDQVLAVKLVNGRGEFVELTSGPALAAARTNLGTLGAVVSVTLQTCPAHNLARHRVMMPIAKVLNRAFMAAHDHAQLFYLPFTEGMYVRTLNRTKKKSSSWLTLGPLRWLESFKENCGVALLFAVSGANCNPERIPKLMQRLQSQMKEIRDVGPSSLQMTSKRWLKYHELEMALDLDDMPAAFEEVRAIIAELATTGPESERFYAHLPVTIRAVKGMKDNLLSPTLGEPTAYISVTSRTNFRGYERYFQEVEKRLSKNFGARPHWAKHQWINPTPLYPDAPAFRKVCEALDPEGKFRNEFVESRIFK